MIYVYINDYYVEIVFTSKQCSSSSVSKIMNLNSQFYVRKKSFYVAVNTHAIA